MIIDGVQISHHGFSPEHNITYDELKNYVHYVKSRVPTVTNIAVKRCDDGFVDIVHTSHNIPFERIRRITGYLVGSIERWNNSKKAEEHDRLKHGGLS